MDFHVPQKTGKSGKSERESVASFANTDKVPKNNGNWVPLENAIEKIRRIFEIPPAEEGRTRGDIYSDKGVIAMCVGFALDAAEEKEREKAKFEAPVPATNKSSK